MRAIRARYHPYSQTRGSYHLYAVVNMHTTCHTETLDNSTVSSPSLPTSLSLSITGRVDQLKRLGHSVDKVEFIVMGGIVCTMVYSMYIWDVCAYDIHMM